jgi:hypothetical protein
MRQAVEDAQFAAPLSNTSATAGNARLSLAASSAPLKRPKHVHCAHIGLAAVIAIQAEKAQVGDHEVGYDHGVEVDMVVVGAVDSDDPAFAAHVDNDDVEIAV